MLLPNYLMAQLIHSLWFGHLNLFFLENQKVISIKQLFLPYYKIPLGDAHTAIVERPNKSPQCHPGLLAIWFKHHMAECLSQRMGVEMFDSDSTRLISRYFPYPSLNRVWTIRHQVQSDPRTQSTLPLSSHHRWWLGWGWSDSRPPWFLLSMYS